MKTFRFPMMLEPELVEKIDTFRHANKIGSRSEAARRLISDGLVKNETATTGSEFGDLNPAAADHHNPLEVSDVKDK